MAESFHLQGIDAMLLAEGDVAIGIDAVKALAEEFKLPYLATNLDCGGGFPQKQLIVEKGGLTVGVLGAVKDTTTWVGCTATDPQAAIVAGVTRLKAQDVDVIVLLDGLSDGQSDGLAKVALGIDLAVGGTNQPLQSPEPLPGGGLRLGPGGRGRTVGVLTWTTVPGATAWREDGTLGHLATQKDQLTKRRDEAKTLAANAASESERAVAEKRAAYYGKQVADVEARLAVASAGSERTTTAHNELVTLDEAIADDPATVTLLDAAKARIAALATEVAPVAAKMGPYVGSATCASCHPGPTTQWQATAHARAYASLVAQKRELDQACFSCHVTGAVAVEGEILGPTSPGAVGTLVNVGCESCHGPGNTHVGNPSSPMANPTEGTCVKCHDAAQDGGRFDFGTYLPEVRHGGSEGR